MGSEVGIVRSEAEIRAKLAELRDKITFTLADYVQEPTEERWRVHAKAVTTVAALAWVLGDHEIL